MELSTRFWAKVHKTDGCWLWIGWNNGSTNDPNRKWPYGQMKIRVDGVWKNQPAHRICWELHYGKIPDGLCVLHKCDNTLCVRPNHLFLGTLKQNTDDMRSKRRDKFWGGPSKRRTGRPPGERIKKKCLHCRKKFQVRPSEAYRVYCSRKCSDRSPNMGRRKGQKLSAEGLAKFRRSRGWVKH